MTHIVLLDGGLGQELRRRSTAPATPLWMAQTVLDEPELVEAVQRDFITAGAKVITLAAYTSTPERLDRDATHDLFQPLQDAAIAIARKAIAGTDTKIGGCLPPLIASYRPELAPEEGLLRATYDRIVEAQIDAVDVFQCETLSSVREVSAAVSSAAASGKPVWCSMSVSDEDGTVLRSGEPLADGVEAAVAAGAQALLINCSSPEAITAGLPVLAASGLAYGAYANGFTSVSALQAGGTVDVLEARQDLDPEIYARIAMGWVAQGATLIGGCCEVGPAHIQAIADALDASGHTIVGEL